jgi:hypothetical protein
MAAGDRYGNNLRRGCRVKDLSDEERGEGEITATITNVRGVVLVRWDGAVAEHPHRGTDLVVIGRAFR